MTRRHRTLTTALALALPLGGCGVLDRDQEPVPLTITASDWNGWDPDHPDDGLGGELRADPHRLSLTRSTPPTPGGR